MTQNSDVLKKNIIVELGLQDLAENRKLDLLGKMGELIQKSLPGAKYRHRVARGKARQDAQPGKKDQLLL